VKNQALMTKSLALNAIRANANITPCRKNRDGYESIVWQQLTVILWCYIDYFLNNVDNDLIGGDLIFVSERFWTVIFAKLVACLRATSARSATAITQNLLCIFSNTCQ